MRLPAPFQPRDDLFLETGFHQGSLEYRPGLIARLQAIAATTPLVIDAQLERPAILSPVVDHTAALLTSVGTSPEALIDVLTGDIRPRGRLPFEIPRSADAVRQSRTDVANDTLDPLYPRGAGLEYGDGFASVQHPITPA